MAYEKFAYYYDSLMDESFYDDYYTFIKENAKYNSILELACGTGELAIRFSKDNKEIYATDISKDILEVARIKANHENVNLLLARIDMVDFKIDRPVDLVLCSCDSINYVLNTKDVTQVFKNAYQSLKYNGHFIFDVNSMHKMNVTLNNYVEHNEDEDFVFDWKVSSIGIGKVKHEIYIEDKIENEKVSETHIQQSYDVDKYVKLLNKAGFKDIELFSDFGKYKEECQRVIFVCKKGR
ncbi:class I SAM-dependent DNA methyltransferase [Tannockella kyphosi]|uniref:class I SAM-dependent DNA methyltransferase n=1 Tax=Tannockella kyphosi TaxID=2899121 RepID=UPI00201203E8|nr:class I SAM-dependent methyltransferase [Tannockella kyphosi]